MPSVTCDVGEDPERLLFDVSVVGGETLAEGRDEVRVLAGQLTQVVVGAAQVTHAPQGRREHLGYKRNATFRVFFKFEMYVFIVLISKIQR